MLCRENKLIYNRNYNRTNKGTIKHWVTKCYGRMKRDERNKFNKSMNFTKEEFYNWLDIDKLKQLLLNYKESNYDKYLCPSIDRINDYDDYNFNNMQLITWNENNIKGRASEKNKKQCGLMSKLKWSKKVLQYDLNNNLISIYESTHDVFRKTGIDSSLVARACRKQKISKGYRWKYA